MRKFWVAKLLLLVFFVVPLSLHAAPWYETASFDCGDPFTLRAGLLGSGWMQRALPFSFPSSGQVYITLLFSDYKGSGGTAPNLFDETVLDEARRTTLRSLLSQVVESSETEALAASLASKLVGFVAGAGASVGPKSLFKYLQEAAESRRVGAKLVSELLAPGGHLVRILTAARDQREHEYLYDTIAYEVMVGTEARSYVLASCYYPVKIVYSRFVTTGGLNDKIFTRQGARWRTFDVDGQRFEGAEWEESDRDEEYIYFKEVGTSRIWRMSFRGGKWQSQRSNGEWGTLYANIRAE